MYERYYKSAKHFGSNEILKKYLKVKDKYIMPVTIPHGVDFGLYENKVMDSDSFEPSYLSHNNFIFNKVKKIKNAIKFPHPWIFLIKNKKIRMGKGDLVISPPPSIDNFENLITASKKIKFSKKKAILIKGRNEKKKYFQFCKRNGFKAEFAGNIEDKKFYLRLFNILNNYRNIYLINMSSAGIFAASLGKKLKVIENCTFEDIDTTNLPNKNSKNYLIVKRNWLKLLSKDKRLSKNLAKKLLGYDFYTSKKLMKEILIDNYQIIKNKPLHLPDLSPHIYQFFISIIKYFPFMVKLYPNPFKKILNFLLRIIGLKNININTYNDFAYFGIKGKFIKFKQKQLKVYKLKNYNLGEAPIKR